MRIHNIDGMSDASLRHELRQGGKFVVYEYAVSILIMTFKRPTDIYFIRSDESAFVKGLGPSLVTLFLGWWGIPWGPIYSLEAIFCNLFGGNDVTEEITSLFSSDSSSDVLEAAAEKVAEEAVEKQKAFCSSCGKVAKSDWKFCKSCGKEIF